MGDRVIVPECYCLAETCQGRIEAVQLLERQPSIAIRSRVFWCSGYGFVKVFDCQLKIPGLA
jgi:hypothetical protein